MKASWLSGPQWALCLILPIVCTALPRHPFRYVERERSHIEKPSRNLTHWLDQKLDHFAKGSAELWKQRYFVNATFFEHGGPVFLCVGGEGPALSAEVVVTGEEHCALMIKLAQEHGALILALEHRFYGESIPTEDLSTESLSYLSSRQALADVAQLHRHISAQYKLKAGTKWISFGGSYPGMLAAWCRVKMPHLFHASVSSSAPVVAVANMQGYNDVTADDLANSAVGGSAECLSTVRAAFDALGEQLATFAGRRSLEQMFNVCGVNALEDVKNRGQLTQSASDVLIPQSNDPSCQGRVCNIQRQCEALLSSELGATPLERLAGLNRLAYGHACMACDHQAESRALTNTSKEGGTARVWFYQTCNEFAFYQTCDPDSRCPFTTAPHLNSLQSYYELCELAFGISGAEVEQHVAESNAYYGGAAPEASRILSVNGEVDPWHVQAVLKSDLRKELPALMVAGASHHFWTHPPKPSDAPEIVAVRLRIGEWVQHFLMEDSAAHYVDSESAGWQ